MSTLPNVTIDPLPVPSSPVWTTGGRPTSQTPWPDIGPIVTSDLVGPIAANRQEAALWRRDETLRDALNKLIANNNALTAVFYQLDGSVPLPPQVGTTPPSGVAARVDYVLDRIANSGQVFTGGGWSLSWDTATQKITLVNDSQAPGVNKVYGTDGSGVRGWQAPNTIRGLIPNVLAFSSSGDGPYSNILIPPGVKTVYVEIRGGNGGNGGTSDGGYGGAGGAGRYLVREIAVNGTGSEYITNILVGGMGQSMGWYYDGTSGPGGGGGGGSMITINGVNYVAGGGGGGGGTASYYLGGAGGNAMQNGYNSTEYTGGAAATYGTALAGGLGGHGSYNYTHGGPGGAGGVSPALSVDGVYILLRGANTPVAGHGSVSIWWRQ